MVWETIDHFMSRHVLALCFKNSHNKVALFPFPSPKSPPIVPLSDVLLSAIGFSSALAHRLEVLFKACSPLGTVDCAEWIGATDQTSIIDWPSQPIFVEASKC